MNLLGAFLLAAAGVWSGWKMRDNLRREAGRCKALCSLLERIAYEIGRFRTPLPTLFGELSTEGACEVNALCGRIAEALDAGASFASAWEEEIAAFPAEERAILHPLGAVLGRYGAPEQTECVEGARRRMEELGSRREGRLRERGRVCVGVGSAAGILLAVLLL